jgi:hypothetical protein
MVVTIVVRKVEDNGGTVVARRFKMNAAVCASGSWPVKAVLVCV